MVSRLVKFVLVVSFFPAGWLYSDDKLSELLSGIDSSLKGVDSAEAERKVWQDSVTKLDAFLAGDPDSPRANYHKGRYLFYLERDSEARAAYRKSINKAPEQIDPHFMLAVLEKFSGNLEVAEALFTKVLKLDPAHVASHLELARILADGGKADDAASHYSKVLEITPKHSDANHRLAVLISQDGRHTEALPYFVKAVEGDPDKYLYRWNLGQCRQSLGKNEEALGDFLNCQKSDPNDWRAFEKIIQLSEALDRTESRDKWLVKMEELKDSGKVPDLVERSFFIRDQFAEGDYRVFGIEYFELIGERAVKYSFQIRKDGDPEYQFKISCGSYEATNNIAHEMKDIPENVRRFHLDGYAPNAHYTYEFFNGNPGYDAVKKLVLEVLRGKVEPMSSSTYPRKDTKVESKPEI